MLNTYQDVHTKIHYHLNKVDKIIAKIKQETLQVYKENKYGVQDYINTNIFNYILFWNEVNELN